jgi:hypothetical protein
VTRRHLQLVQPATIRRVQIALRLASEDVIDWREHGLLPRLLQVRDEPGALSCEWTDDEVRDVARELRIPVGDDDVDAIIATEYAMALRVVLEALCAT